MYFLAFLWHFYAMYHVVKHGRGVEAAVNGGRPRQQQCVFWRDGLKEIINKMGVQLIYAGDTCVGWGQTTDARVLVGTPSTAGAGSKTHLESRCCAILIFD